VANPPAASILFSVRHAPFAFLVLSAAFLAGCSQPPPGSSKVDVTREPWYAQLVEQLTVLTRDAETAYRNGKPDDAAALIKKAEPLRDRAVAVNKPTLGAMEAASDLDDLYGRMLLKNRHYGWARLQFQKNVSRWKHWEPRTPDTERRFKQAQDLISECDRKMAE